MKKKSGWKFVNNLYNTIIPNPQLIEPKQWESIMQNIHDF